MENKFLHLIPILITNIVGRKSGIFSSSDGGNISKTCIEDLCPNDACSRDTWPGPGCGEDMCYCDGCSLYMDACIMDSCRYSDHSVCVLGLNDICRRCDIITNDKDAPDVCTPYDV